MPERAIQGVRSAVELARKGLTGGLRSPHELVASVRTHVMEGADYSIFAISTTDHEGRGVTDRQVFDQIITRIGNLVRPTDIEPRFTKDPRTLLLEIFP